LFRAPDFLRSEDEWTQPDRDRDTLETADLRSTVWHKNKHKGSRHSANRLITSGTYTHKRERKKWGGGEREGGAELGKGQISATPRKLGI
jgi:hypothetical protein